MPSFRPPRRTAVWFCLNNHSYKRLCAESDDSSMKMIEYINNKFTASQLVQATKCRFRTKPLLEGFIKSAC